MPDAVSATGAQATYSSTTSADRKDQMGKDVFMKLLVAQMRYQDPSSPVDSSQMMSQTATFSQVEKLEQLVAQNASMLALQRSSSAGALVGKTVSYTDETGATKTGTVSAVRLGGDKTEATAVVGGAVVAMGRITEVASTPAPTPAATP